MNPAPLRVGLVGAGAVAQVAHIPAYHRLRNAELIAICDLDAPKRRALRDRTGVRHSVASLEELLAIDEVEAVDVCLPNYLHRDAVLRSLEAGKHVLCEKPLGLGSGEVMDMLAAQERSGKTLLVGMNNRYRDDSILLQSFIEGGALGDVFYVKAGWLKRREAIKAEAWHVQRELSGGGVLMDLGIQLLDLALWLSGYPEPERAVASFFYHSPEIDVEDSAVATVTCAGGLTINLQASWHFLMDADRHELELFGTTGSGLLNPIRVFQRMHGKLVNVTPQEQRRMRNIYMESYEREIAFFAEVAGGRAEAPPLSEQLTLARVIEALQRSAREGREVRLTDGSAAS